MRPSAGTVPATSGPKSSRALAFSSLAQMVYFSTAAVAGFLAVAARTPANGASEA